MIGLQKKFWVAAIFLFLQYVVFLNAQEVYFRAKKNPNTNNKEDYLSLAVKLKKQNQLLRIRLKAITFSLAETNAENLKILEENKTLKQKIEAISLLENDIKQTNLQNNFVEALKELKISHKKNLKLEEILQKISYEADQYLASSLAYEPKKRENLQKINIEAKKNLNKKVIKNTKNKINKAKVIAIRKDLGLLILDVGKSGGARASLPMKVMRKDKEIELVLIVDVREDICGAIPINFGKNQKLKAKVGDKVKLLIEKTEI